MLVANHIAPVVNLNSEPIDSNGTEQQETAERVSSQSSFDDSSFDDSSLDADTEVSRLKTKLDEYFYSGATKAASWRIRQLKSLMSMLQKEEKQFAQALHADLGKSPEEAFFSEIGFLTKEIKSFIKKTEKWMKPNTKSTPLLAFPAKSMTQAEPLGTCLVIGAWNYPLMLSLSPMLAAISAGNCVILKPSEKSPATSALLAKMLPQYLDMNAFGVVEGGIQPTSDLLALPFDKIFYTGGERVGKIVMQAAAKHLTRVTLELGGKSPCIIDKNINLNTALKRIVWGKLMNVGQTCVCPDYLLVHHSNLDNVLEKIKQIIVRQYKKDPKQNRFYGRVVDSDNVRRLAGYLEGQEVVYGGQYSAEERYFAPTIVLNPAPESDLMQEEIFGPIIPILSFNGRSDMLQFIKRRAKPLAAYAFTEDKEFEEKFIDTISAGSMCINDISMFMANEELPFGGVGTSGMGNYHGKYGFDTFSHQKSIMRRSFSFENSFRYMPLNSIKMWILKRFL